ncbi:molybdopterin-guanine dinucleotide biosynthesis protein B [Paenibacillus sp. JNUCC31]|uniref:molybdopterin-guanine dinucleotide biosynthesis protein B n=1 Tax=Paenibacillus sp. JNUCC-31 TaxID=2777983 RepID=UPI00177E61DF|nr:molybdopterin-guanine dinucleotide biosynthesis protein B [Paenibacillus sp. JNUCC-31]QOS79611.1 molybdopterin-guanine dinucleotide biosynthesis protein B [Paenibacillus sp. JNUCC-31]
MNMIRSTAPYIVQIVGYKNTGKSTLTAALTRFLTSIGRKVAVIKHDGHDHFEMDHAGTDSYGFTQAGAAAVVIMSETRTAIMEQQPTRLDNMLSYLADYDWILIEGYKQATFPKLLLVREEKDTSLIETLHGVIGIISWLPFENDKLVQAEGNPVWHSVDETEQIAKWLISLEGNVEENS